MALFKVGKDFETSESAGAGGMFQIDTLLDENDENITDRIDVGTHFSDNQHLLEYLSEIFNISYEDIEIEEL